MLFTCVRLNIRCTDLLHTFLDRVHGAATQLAAACGGVEDYAGKLTFLGQVAAQDRALEAAASEVHAVYALLDEHGLTVGAEDRAAYSGLEAAHSALKAQAEEVEAAREGSVAQYSAELDACMEAVAQEVTALRGAAHADVLLSPDTAHATAVDELLSIKGGLEKQAAEVARINCFQRMFRVGEAGCDDLAATADDVALKLELWNGREGERVGWLVGWWLDWVGSGWILSRWGEAVHPRSKEHPRSAPDQPQPRNRTRVRGPLRRVAPEAV